jgi:hypothetical protein
MARAKSGAVLPPTPSIEWQMVQFFSRSSRAPSVESPS